MTLTFLDLPDPFIIAEIGGNHEGDFDYALRLAQQAIDAGAHAVKFQAYSPDRIVSAVQSPERNRHFRRFALTERQYVELAQSVREMGAKFMASVWDREYLELLDPYIEVHKIGSGDLTNLPLVKRLAATDKPLCAATAMATLDEVRDFIDFVDSVNPRLRPTNRLCVMHCVATYGTPEDRYANLGAIETMRRELPQDVVIGYSDHTVGTIAITTAVCIGARVIEAHFTDDTTRDFRDHHFSKDRASLADFMHFCDRRKSMLGTGVKAPVPEVETPERIREFRRGVYYSRDVAPGEVAGTDNLTTLRPLNGIDARHYDRVVGMKVRASRLAFEPVAWEDLEPLDDRPARD